jgi:hypothetical protein
MGIAWPGQFEQALNKNQAVGMHAGQCR